MGQQIEDLATFIAGGRWEDVPGNIQARVKYALLDTVGVILAGSLRPEVQSLRAALLKNGGTGATLLAPGMQATDPGNAAMLNAIAGRSIELCDGLLGVQPSVQIVPGLLAIGEARQSSGRDLLTAFLMGYEVAGRLASGFTPRPLAHPNGQVALLACAAAGARLLGLDGAGISRSMRDRDDDADGSELHKHRRRRDGVESACRSERFRSNARAGIGPCRLRGAG